MATNTIADIGTTLNTASPAQIAAPTLSTPINTSQPSPTNTNTQPNAGDAQVLANQKAMQALGIANAPGVGSGTPAQKTADKYQGGYATSQEKGTPTATSKGDAMSMVNDATKQSTIDTQAQEDQQKKIDNIQNELKNDPGYQQLQADYKAYTDSVNKQQSLVDQYSQMEKDSNLPGLKIDAMNLKNIMDGTENDIRQEITKAGGFATESQVLALTNARNKQNILDYNKLTDNINNIQKHLDTMIGLSKEDKANMLQEYKTQIDYDKTINDYIQKFNDNAKSAYEKIVSTPGYGYKALYDSTGGDPALIAQVEKSMGFTPGILAKLGSQPGNGNFEVVKGGTDAYGNTLPDSVFNKDTGKFVNGYSNSNTPVSGNTQPQSSLPQSNTVISSGAYTGPVTKGLDFAQYGLLVNTNLNPSNQVDQLAQKYIDQYIKNQSVPTSIGGRKMTVGAMAEVATRAGELFYQATGHSLPNTQQLKEFNKEISQNNSVLNKNAIQADTVIKNFDLAIKGEITNNVNKNATAINKILNPIYLALGDPAVNQALVSNGTISQEFANLISIRNQGGTLASDKEMAAHLIAFGTSVEAQKAVVERLKQEAGNIHDALNNRNKDLYKQVDPLAQDPNNPLRNQYALGSELDKQHIPYEDLKNQMYTAANRAANPGKQPAWDKINQRPAFATPSEINSGNFIPI